MIEPQMSGHCASPQTAHPEESHARCERMGAGNHSRPSKEYQPCPCRCHFPDEEYECENCGGVLVEAAHWPNEDPDDVDEDENPYPVYVHLAKTGDRVTGQDC